MLEPGYEKLISLGISDVVFDRHDIYKASVKYSHFVNRSPKINYGSDLLAQNKSMVKLIIDDLHSFYKKGGLEDPLS